MKIQELSTSLTIRDEAVSFDGEDIPLYFDEYGNGTEEAASGKKVGDANKKENNKKEYVPCYCFLRAICCSLAIWHYRWPRVSSIVIGIIVPLLILIAMSDVFGSSLAKLEGPNEIKQNDQFLATEAMAKMVGSLAQNLTARTPRICQELYLQNRTFEKFAEKIKRTVDTAETSHEILTLTAHLEEKHPDSAKQFEKQFQGKENRLVSIDVIDMYDIMRQCGQALHPLVQRLNNLAMVASQDVGSGDLTLNWNQCVKGAFVGMPLLHKRAFKPSSQFKRFRQGWSKDQQRLYRSNLKTILASNISKSEAKIEAFTMSIDQASGGHMCNTNADAGAWFWFTFQTTIGYGDQAPSTKDGRSLVYKLGFFCILAFAFLLGTAGYITLAIFDDLLDRFQLDFAKKPWVESFFWGFLYFNWQFVIATFTLRWKRERLGVTFSLEDSFWFSFISTTTIGLGDISLEPMCIVGDDLFTFPMLFLTGFVLLSAFLGKFVQALKLILVPANLKNANLQERLRNSWQGPPKLCKGGVVELKNGRVLRKEVSMPNVSDRPWTLPSLYWCIFASTLMALLFLKRIFRNSTLE